ncbi:MAG: DNA polymerase III subunit alpha [Alphaproteobacteria bacterium]
MPHADFVHLRVHSAYSLSEGAIKIKALATLCRAHAMPAVAVTDRSNLFGVLEFGQACAEVGVQPIVGCVLGIARGPGAAGANRAPEPDDLVLLVQNETGYRNLIKLVSRAYLATEVTERPQVSAADLAAHTEGLIALTGGPGGGVGRLLGEGQLEAAEDLLSSLARLLPGRLYVELMRHGLEVENRIEPALLELAYRHDLPLVATNDVYFADAGMFEAHDVLICIADGRVLSDPDRRRFTPDHRFKSAAEMRALFADLPEAVDNTLVIARRCAYLPEAREPLLPSYPTAGGRDEAEELRANATAGLARRLEAHVLRPGHSEEEREHAVRSYWQRLDYELDVIAQMGFAGYFLIVADFIQWAKSQGIPVGPGRGSGAGSVVAWALTITDLDPLRWGLLFERFLNPERVSMPDFDIDFCQERRDEVIRYVQKKYGRDRVAQIITFGTLQARAALRDVGRVLQMPYGQVDRICKLVPYNPANPISLEESIAGEPQLQKMRDEDPAVARLMDIALQLEGLYRHASTHAAGVVIGDRPLDELVPLYRDPRSEMPVTQFAMKYVEMAGLVKFDFLGLKTLTVLALAEDLIRAAGGTIDLGNLPLDDPATYEMLGHGETVGVFQLESSGMRDALRRLQPDRFEDIIALVALYRPGPMDNIPKYIACKHGQENPDYMDPSLHEILKETFGVIIYQEQVMQIAQVLSGYTLGGADLLRRAMGKKIKSEMDAQRRHFVDGAVARGVSESRASHIFDHVAKFAGYGFNKSHAAAYALVAYQTAYMKANHARAFLAASMTYDMGNTDKLNVYRQEIGRLGLKLLPPDVNRSGATFTVEPVEGDDRGIRYALAAVKNVGAGAMAELVKERERGGPFRGLHDFARRLDTKVLNKRQLESLVSAGAFDSLDSNRARVFQSIESMIRLAASAAEARASGQVSLFGDEPAGALPQPAAAAKDWSPSERLTREFESIGFYLSAHPLDAYGHLLARLAVVPSIRLPMHVATGGNRVRLAGIVTGKQERTSARGNRFAFVQLSDTGGAFEVTVFSELLASARALLEAGSPLLVTAEARLEGDSVRLTAQSIEALDKASEHLAGDIRIVLRESAPAGDAVAALRGVIEKLPRGKCRIHLVVPVPGRSLGSTREVEIGLKGGYSLSPSVLAGLREAGGVAAVHEL